MAVMLSLADVGRGFATLAGNPSSGLAFCRFRAAVVFNVASRVG